MMLARVSEALSSAVWTYVHQADSGSIVTLGPVICDSQQVSADTASYITGGSSSALLVAAWSMQA